MLALVSLTGVTSFHEFSTFSFGLLGLYGRLLVCSYLILVLWFLAIYDAVTKLPTIETLKIELSVCCSSWKITNP